MNFIFVEGQPLYAEVTIGTWKKPIPILIKWWEVYGTGDVCVDDEGNVLTLSSPRRRETNIRVTLTHNLIDTLRLECSRRYADFGKTENMYFDFDTLKAEVPVTWREAEGTAEISFDLTDQRDVRVYPFEEKYQRPPISAKVVLRKESPVPISAS